jgi:hypothetical protein
MRTCDFTGPHDARGSLEAAEIEARPGWTGRVWSESVKDNRIPVRYTATMARVMLPRIESGMWTVLWLALAFVEMIEAIGINVNSVVTPIPMIPSPKYGDYADGNPSDGAWLYTGPQGNEVVRGIVGVGPRTIYRRIVYRHINRFRIDRLDCNRLIQCGYCLLVHALQAAGGVGPGAQTLDCIHDIRLLRQESITELLHPTELVIHHPKYLRKRDQRLYAGSPVLVFKGRCEFIAAKS